MTSAAANSAGSASQAGSANWVIARPSVAAK